MTNEPTPRPTRQQIVDRYGLLARAAWDGAAVADCGPTTFTEGRYGTAAYADGTGLDDLPDGVIRASLGCGNPVAVADLRPGETVLDLGSGGGIDVLLSARRVGPTGLVYGLDASPDMLGLARAAAAEAGVTNVDLVHGHIEDIPLPNGSVDVVISNCVINLSTDKPRVLAEAFRVLQPGGRFGVSDVLAHEDLTPNQRSAAEERNGCAAGAITQTTYQQTLQQVGFIDIRIAPTTDPGDGVYSAIVRATKPAA
jgi:SAM-dependent methyltransferase